MKNSTTVRAIRLISRTSALFVPALAALWFEKLFMTPRRLQPPKREIDWLASARRGDLKINANQTLPIYTWGEGPIVLLAHGWSGRGSQMAGFSQSLVEAGFQVIAFDAPGHGQAEPSRSGLYEFSMAIQQIVETIGPVYALIAHSLGAAASTIALSNGMAVERLVYLASPENPGGYVYRVARFLGFGDAVANRVEIRMEKRYGRSFERCRGGALAPNFDTPLLVVHDLDDRDIPHEDGVRLVEAWPGAQLMTTSGLGHNRVLRADKVINSVTNFLKPADRDTATLSPDVGIAFPAE